MSAAVSIARKDRVGTTTKGLNPLVCNFGDVKLGDTCMHAVTLHNHSNAVAFYQFQVGLSVHRYVVQCELWLGESVADPFVLC